MKKTNTLISKTGLLKGALCIRSYWYYYKMPALRKQLTESERAIINHGITVGKLARDLFPGGVDVTDGGKHFGESLLKRTDYLISKGATTLYEAAFKTPYDDFFFQADILLIKDKELHIIEVKSSTSIKEKHRLDTAIQKRILMNLYPGVTVRTFIATINKDYLRKGDIKIRKLFSIEEVEDSLEPEVDSIMRACKQALTKTSPPENRIGKHCFDSKCEFRDICFENAEVPQYSIFDIGNIRKDKATALFHAGYKSPQELPLNIQMSDKQKIEILSAREGLPQINYKAIEVFVKTLQMDREMFFMDFETFHDPLVPFDDLKPWEHICFQYCVIYQSKPGAKLERREFLADPNSDPRRRFIESLLRDTKGSGTIAVYNQKFEIGRLKRLAELFPDLSSDIEDRVNRIMDILLPFSERHYWDSLKFKGSASIKKVLPALTGISYDNLEIPDGAIAMSQYANLGSKSPEERSKIIQDLKDYCYQDVYGLVQLTNSLQKLVIKNNKK